jgi:hypothetical protein
VRTPRTEIALEGSGGNEQPAQGGPIEIGNREQILSQHYCPGPAPSESD